jgi:transposase
MNLDQKKELAKLLFVRENQSQKEIAEKVGVSEVTISKWVKANDSAWKRLRQSITITKEEQLRRAYDQLDELNQQIESKPKGQRYPDTKEADTLIKITNTIKNLETEVSISDIVEVTKRFLNWLRPVNLEKAKDFSGYFDSFIKDQFKK